MKISELRLFNELVNNQLNVSRTAVGNNMVQSAVTRNIQSLEHSLGMPLVIRQGKKLVGLTDLGKIVLDRSKEILFHVNNLQAIADDHTSTNTGKISIATTNTQSRFFLPSVITQFRKSYPQVQLHLLQGDPKQLIQYLYEGRADIAICTESVSSDPNLKVMPCYNWNHIAIMHPDHSLAGKRKLAYKDISAHPLLTYAFYLTGGGRIRQAFQKAGFALNIVFTALDTEVIKTYVQLNLGIGIVAGMAERDVHQSGLVCRSIDHLIGDSTTKIAWLKEKYQTAYMKRFIHNVIREGTRMMSTTKQPATN